VLPPFRPFEEPPPVGFPAVLVLSGRFGGDIIVPGVWSGRSASVFVPLISCLVHLMRSPEVAIGMLVRRMVVSSMQPCLQAAWVKIDIVISVDVDPFDRHMQVSLGRLWIVVEHRAFSEALALGYNI
jgi:hypothetical protein